MKRITCLLLVVFTALWIFGKESFTVTYTFDNTLTPLIGSAHGAMSGKEVVAGGSKVLSQSYTNNGATTARRIEIQNNNTNFTNTYLRMDVLPAPSYAIQIDSIRFRQRASMTGGAYNFKVGCTVNAALPDANTASATQYFTSDFSNFLYIPARNVQAEGFDYVSVWISGRGLNSAPIFWDIDEVVVYGSYTNAEKQAVVVNVSGNKKQKIRLGIDAERLWYWRSGIKDQLAQKAVGEMKSDFARVAINAAYELDQGVKNMAAYNEILEVMTVFKNANPDIKLFASPRPLHEAYTEAQKIAIWGHANNVPWSPYPAWIQTWVQNGTTTIDGVVVPKWEKGAFDVDALIQYYADYLNFMYVQGFYIDFLDLSNEQTIITPAIAKYMRDNLPSKLNAGVSVPKFVAPSTWDVQGGINWLDNIDQTKNEHLAFEIAAAHNTGAGTQAVYDEFAAKAQALDKEAWNSELHEWVGIELQDEIINSSIFWEHMRAGFTGIDTWLFFGPGAGKPHSMIFAYPNRLETTGKYEIFKQVVNNSNGGNYVEISQPFTSTPTSAFVKDNVLSVWILNKNTRDMNDVSFQLDGWEIRNQNVNLIKWNKNLPKEGESSSFANQTENEFTYDIKGESLYFFKMNVEATTNLTTSLSSNLDFEVFYNTESGKISIQRNKQEENGGFYSIRNIQGQLMEKAGLKGRYTESNCDTLPKGMYVISIEEANRRYSKKVLVY